jgi:hypothetical protein
MGTEKRSESLANLKPFQPGQSGNPAGRPKGQRDYATIYREALQKIAAARGVTPNEIEELIEQTGLDKALEGDYKFFQDIRDRIHGKPKQGIEHTGEGGGPLQVNIKMV